MSVVQIPSAGSQTTVAKIEGLTDNDLGPFSSQELLVYVNRSTAVIAKRSGQHLTVQTLADGQSTPVSALDTDQVGDYPAARVYSAIITEDGNVYFVMYTPVAGDASAGQIGGQYSIFAITPQGNLVRVLTEGRDGFGRSFGPGWTLATNGFGRVVMNDYYTTWLILPPK